MTLVVMLALGAGVGLMGVVTGLRSHRSSLQAVLTGLSAEPIAEGRREQMSWPRGIWRVDHRAGLWLARSVREHGVFDRKLRTRLALANSTLEELSVRCVACATIGFLLPFVAWVVVVAGGLQAPLLVPVGSGTFFGLGGVLVPIAALNADAKRGLRHTRRVICSFLDLVVLGLAGGMGIESALFAAAQLGENVVSRRMVAALSLCRDSGEPPWEALARLGEMLGVDELSELAATAGLAGMEGAKVRSTLAARAATIRRHELANAEAEANALTEKLFIPGAFLLVGFLIFIGYPAFTRIASGF
jgi:pilus assembly protein TadC